MKVLQGLPREREMEEAVRNLWIEVLHCCGENQHYFNKNCKKLIEMFRWNM